MIIIINTNTVAVQNETDLRNAVSDNAINYIYLANNIAITSGITIPPNKTSLVFDGEYPLNSGVRNEFTDVNSYSYFDTLGIRETSSITLTFRNMIIHGRNFYGVPYIVESTLGIINTDNVSVIYENVRYTGVQITYNCNGYTRYTDCEIVIQQNGNQVAQEAGEVNRVEFSGRTTILHTSISSGDDYAVFWFRGTVNTMSLTVLESAQVEIISQNCYFMYNIDSFWGISYPLPYVIRARASLYLTMSKGISYDYRNQLSSFLVEQNASFNYIQTGNNGTNSSVYINGTLNVQQGARFYMGAQNGIEPLIQFTSGTGRSLNVDNPFSFVLYCVNSPVLVSLATTQVSLHGGQLNTWSTAGNGGMDNTPEFKWKKKDYNSSVEFNGTLTQSTTTVTSNLTLEDEPYPAILNLHLHSARVISMGDWNIGVNPIEDDGRAITGSTEANANIRTIYTIESFVHILNGIAGEEGRFSIDTSTEIPPNIPAGTEVEIWVNIPYLIKETLITAISAGSLMIIDAPALITFITPPISTNPVLLARLDPLIPVVIEDIRADRGNWELAASISGPLMTEFGDELSEAVVFLESAGSEPITLSETPIVVRTGGEISGINNVSWSWNEGILIRVTKPIRMGVKYSTNVIWELHSNN